MLVHGSRTISGKGQISVSGWESQRAFTAEWPCREGEELLCKALLAPLTSLGTESSCSATLWARTSACIKESLTSWLGMGLGRGSAPAWPWEQVHVPPQLCSWDFFLLKAQKWVAELDNRCWSVKLLLYHVFQQSITPYSFLKFVVFLLYNQDVSLVFYRVTARKGKLVPQIHFMVTILSSLRVTLGCCCLKAHLS